MNPTQVHIFITHLPVFGLFLSLLVILYGVTKKVKEVNIIALILLLISVSGGIIAYLTGEFAEDTVESVAGISEPAIEEHEEAAELTVVLFYSLALLSLVVMHLVTTNKRMARAMLFITIGVQVLTLSSVVRTASLGGKIRHTEITSGSTQGNSTESSEHEEEEERD